MFPICAPGQKSFLVPLSLCPGTRAAAKIPGQAFLSRDIPRDKMALYQNSRLINGRFPTLSSPFFANYMNFEGHTFVCTHGDRMLTNQDQIKLLMFMNKCSYTFEFHDPHSLLFWHVFQNTGISYQKCIPLLRN